MDRDCCSHVKGLASKNSGGNAKETNVGSGLGLAPIYPAGMIARWMTRWQTSVGGRFTARRDMNKQRVFKTEVPHEPHSCHQRGMLGPFFRSAFIIRDSCVVKRQDTSGPTSTR